MSNTPAESVVPEATVTETGKQPKKFDNVHKSVASKAKAFLNVFHSTGENIRGSINAALDGAGDAIAGRKPNDVSGRKSAEQPSRRSLEPTATSSAPAPSPVAVTETPAAVAVETPAAATSSEVAPETNVVADTPAEGNAPKRFPVGQFINLRLKRTMDLVTRVGSTLRSKSTRTVESLGSTLTEGKQRASRRFSRAPKPVPEAGEADDATPAPAETPLPDIPAVNQTSS